MISFVRSTTNYSFNKVKLARHLKAANNSKKIKGTFNSRGVQRRCNPERRYRDNQFEEALIGENKIT